MSKKSKNLRIDLQVVLPETELPILAAVQERGREMMKEWEESQGVPVEAGTDPLAHYGEQYMEDLSEAGYSETPANNRLSCRAFGHLLRIKPDDLKQVKQALRYRHSEYHDLALCDTIVTALSRSTDLAPALSLLKPSEDLQPKGPFYPWSTEQSLAKSLDEAVRQAKVNQTVTQQIMTPEEMAANFLDQMVKDHQQVSQPLSAIDAAAVKLAGALRLNKSELLFIASALVSAGANNDTLLQVTLAHVVLATVSVTPRLVAGLNGIQPR